jgi:hypothetical protein
MITTTIKPMSTITTTPTPSTITTTATITSRVEGVGSAARIPPPLPPSLSSSSLPGGKEMSPYFLARPARVPTLKHPTKQMQFAVRPR